MVCQAIPLGRNVVSEVCAGEERRRVENGREQMREMREMREMRGMRGCGGSGEFIFSRIPTRSSFCIGSPHSQ